MLRRSRSLAVFGLTAFLIAAALVAASLEVGSAADGRSIGSGVSRAVRAPSATTAASAPLKPPSIVLILADDLDYGLVQQMPHLLAMQRSSAYFVNSFVVDSLCCSSRASTFTGMYPHNSLVRTNTTGPDKAHPVGGWKAFDAAGDNLKSFAYAVDNRRPAPYRTALMGKFLNRYKGTTGSAVPAGWSTFNAITTNGYANWDYDMTQVVVRDGVSSLSNRHYGKRPQDYATTVLAQRAVSYVRSAERGTSPYLLEVAPYATHRRVSKAAHPTKGDGNCGTTSCRRLKASSLVGFDDSTADNTPRFADGSLAPAWNTNVRLDPARRRQLTANYRNRAQMAQSLDRLIGSVRASVGPNTYVVVSSDNGYHLGENRMGVGKGTAYEHDTRVPLVISGPGVKPGPRRQVVTNVDLAPTFEQIAGLTPVVDRDGTSLLPILRNPAAPAAQYAFVEHTRPARSSNDPDSEPSIDRVPSYLAVRSADALLVRYDTAAGNPAGFTYEFYRGLSRTGVFERTNTYDPADPDVRLLAQKLAQFDGCAGAACQVAVR